MPEPCQWGLSNQQKKTSVQRNTPLKTSFSKRWPGTVLLVAIGDETLEGIPGHLSFGRVKLIRVYLVQLLGFADWVGSLDHVGIYTNEQMTTEDFPHLRLAASTVVPLPLHAPFFFLSCSATRSSEGAFEVRWCVRWRVEVKRRDDVYDWDSSLRACGHCLGRSSSPLRKEDLFLRQLKAHNQGGATAYSWCILWAKPKLWDSKMACDVT